MKKAVYTLAILFFSTACLTEIQFDYSDEEAVVISGVITNSMDERTIFVNHSKGIEAEVSKINATGAIYKNGELDVELIPLREGELVAPIWFKVEEGATYHVEITTKDQQIYQSIPQIVPQRMRTDSLAFILSQKQKGFNNLGVPINIWLVDVYAYINIPAQSQDRYYKWHIDESWSFESEQATCYLRKSVKENPVTVISSKEVEKGLIPIRIASVELDQSFFYKHYFNAYLHSIDEASFDYYRKVHRLTNNTGSLYDEIPAPIKGNIFLSKGKTETVVGNIEFSLSDTLRLPIENEDIEIQLFNVCKTGSPCPPPPPPPEPIPPCVCRNCVALFGIGSLVKPIYWE